MWLWGSRRRTDTSYDAGQGRRCLPALLGIPRLGMFLASAIIRVHTLIDVTADAADGCKKGARYRPA